MTWSTSLTGTLLPQHCCSAGCRHAIDDYNGADDGGPSGMPSLPQMDVLAIEDDVTDEDM